MDVEEKESGKSLILKDVSRESEIGTMQLKLENKDLKENFNKLMDNYTELKKKVSITNIIIENGEIHKIKDILSEKENENLKLKDRINSILIENDKYNKKIELYERNLNEKVKHEGLLQGVCLFNLKLYESRLFKYFNEIVIKNIDKREVAKKKNKILLEKLLILGKKFEKLKSKNVSNKDIVPNSITFNRFNINANK